MAGKDPAALIYIANFLTATAEMRGDCCGWFFRLVLHQYDKKSLPNDIEELANLANVRASEFNVFQQVWQQVLKHKFAVLPTGRLYNVEVDEIIRSRELFVDKRTVAGHISAFTKFIRKHLCKDENVISFIKKNVDPNKITTSDQQVLKQVFKQMYQLYIDIDIDIDKDRIEDDVGGAGGEEGAREGYDGDLPKEDLDDPPDGWNQFPGPEETSLELPELKAICALELLVLNGTKAEREHIDKLWYVFKNQHFNSKKFYHSPTEVFSHFINWSKTQKVNGNSHQQHTPNGKSAGASELADKLAKKLAARGNPNFTG